MDSASLIHGLYSELVNADLCAIQLIPFSEVPVVVESNDGVTEIGITKQGYLKIFKDSHTYWHQHVLSVDYTECQKENDLLNAYYCTLGYLLTTNENHSVITLHEKLFFKLLQFENTAVTIETEFKLVTALLTSRLKRINKSSSLWFWLKKLSIIHIFDRITEEGSEIGSISDAFHRLVDCIVKASELHFANYYAANYLRWCIRLMRVKSESIQNKKTYKDILELSDYIKDNLIRACRKNLTDVSLWSNLSVLVNSATPQEVVYVLEDYNNTVENFPRELRVEPLQYNTNSQNEYRSIYQSIISDEIKWLIKVRCLTLTPYLALRSQESSHIVKESLLLERGHLQKLKLQQLEPSSFIYENTEMFIGVLETVEAKFEKIAGHSI